MRDRLTEAKSKKGPFTVAIGERAPAFAARGPAGEEYEFRPAELERPAILIFYRGGWCPFCNLELQALQQHLPEFRSLGAALVAAAAASGTRVRR